MASTEEKPNDSIHHTTATKFKIATQFWNDRRYSNDGKAEGRSCSTMVTRRVVMCKIEIYFLLLIC